MIAMILSIGLSTSSIIDIYRPGPETPGAVDSTKTKEILCDPKYHTGSARPPTFYTNNLKKNQIIAKHLDMDPSAAEEDHLISLQLGGDPMDPKNLWPQPYCKPSEARRSCFGAREKDVVEGWLHRQVCSGKMTLQEAQHQIATDWFEVWVKLPYELTKPLVKK